MERKGLRRWMYPLCSHISNWSGREGSRAQPLKEWHRLCCLVISNSLWPHGLQHARPLCPSPSPKVCPSSCPLHQWCHPIISSSYTLFSFCPQSFPSSGTFPMSQLFASDDQNTGVSASASVLPMSMQSWFPLRLTGLTFLLSRRLSGVFSSTIVRRHQFFCVLPCLWSNSHNCMWPLTMHIFARRIMSAFQHTV